MFLAALGWVNASAGSGATYDDPIWLEEGVNDSLKYDADNGVWYSFMVPPLSQTTFESTYGLPSIAYFTTTEEDAMNAVHDAENSFRNGSYPWSYKNLTNDSVQVWMQLMEIQPQNPKAQAITVTTVSAAGTSWDCAVELSVGDNEMQVVEEGGSPRWYKASVSARQTAKIKPSSSTTANIFIGEEDAQNETNASSFKFGVTTFEYENSTDDIVPIYIKVKKTTGETPSLNYSLTSDGIEDVNVNPDHNEESQFYTVSGQKTDASAKGIIIRNGKTYIVK